MQARTLGHLQFIFIFLDVFIPMSSSVNSECFKAFGRPRRSAALQRCPHHAPCSIPSCAESSFGGAAERCGPCSTSRCVRSRVGLSWKKRMVWERFDWCYLNRSSNISSFGLEFLKPVDLMSHNFIVWQLSSIVVPLCHVIWLLFDCHQAIQMLQLQLHMCWELWGRKQQHLGLGLHLRMADAVPCRCWKKEVPLVPLSTALH